MGKPKKSAVWEFFEQRAHLKARVTCAHLKKRFLRDQTIKDNLVIQVSVKILVLTHL